MTIRKIFIIGATVLLLYLLVTLYFSIASAFNSFQRFEEGLLERPLITIATHMSSEDERVMGLVTNLQNTVLDNNFYVETKTEKDEKAQEVFTSIEFFVADPMVCKHVNQEELNKQITSTIAEYGVTQEVRYYSGQVRNANTYSIRNCVRYANIDVPSYILKKTIDSFPFSVYWPLLMIFGSPTV